LKKGSKYRDALKLRERYEDRRQSKNETSNTLEEFKKQEELANMSAFERSVYENRRQREYLLKEY